MQLAALSERLAISPVRIRAWVRLKAVLPVDSPGGRGRHNDYDDASLLVAGVAATLEELDVPLGRYERAFADAHKLLRARSSLEWNRMVLELVPLFARLRNEEDAISIQAGSIQVKLAPLCASLMHSQSQRTLQFGVHGL